MSDTIKIHEDWWLELWEEHKKMIINLAEIKDELLENDYVETTN